MEAGMPVTTGISAGETSSDMAETTSVSFRVISVTTPVVASVGTATTNEVAEAGTTSTILEDPVNFTCFTRSRFVPVMVTSVPAIKAAGLSDVIAGTT